MITGFENASETDAQKINQLCLGRLHNVLIELKAVKIA